ncbi:vacuolar protein sorting 55 [Gorgonomyces haynaldii]|nr:vacuolar protein sorting 55 [Gorgonomyces haynaldii]
MTMLVIIGLAFLLASGILSVILSCALDNNWLPLLVVLTYVLAPIPNALTKRVGSDLFQDEGRGILETGYFITSFFIVSGFGLPLVLNHSKLITDHAMILSLVGGLLIYATIVMYMRVFGRRQDLYI